MKDIGDVCSSSAVGKNELNCRRQKIVKSAMELTTMATHPKGFASMTEGLRPGITVNTIISGS
jgi:hypothetical protein